MRERTVPTELQTLYIDFDAFFANVEKQDNPALHGRPVGVQPFDSQYSGVIACCYQAKAAGIKRGTKTAECRDLCPEITLLPARHDVYVDYHKRIIACIERHLKVEKVWSIDEMECDLRGFTRAQAIEIARKIQTDIRLDIGEYVTPSIGLAANQLLAKICSEMEKPNGFVVLHPADMPGKLLNVPLGDIPGVAKGNLRRLDAAGIWNMEQLLAISAKQARALWGNIEGERLWAQLKGYPVMRPPTKRRMFGHGRILTREWSYPDRAKECLRLLTCKAARRLRADGFYARKLSISLSFIDGQKLGVERQFPPSKDDFRFVGEMDQAFTAMIAVSRSKRVKKVSVTLHGLSKPEETPGDLFTWSEENATRTSREKLSDVMDSINSKSGQALIHLGPREALPGGYAGAKIAFGRVPTDDDFAESKMTRKIRPRARL
ncbi:Y-family DNA polymerase [Robiginitomaculum antarcticum]|uniref:Y-family DNA polymerase n=1 Tax=Robiginitomaculum antarcticum TaxID=437507 RepID=UPI000367EC9B|nr:hypothetical protein [Robiginitomaculum antarcticum]